MEFLLGVLAGVLATLVVAVVGPALVLARNLLAGEPLISGKWSSFDVVDPAMGRPVGTATIRQVGRVVQIRLTRTIHRDGSATLKQFIYRGRFGSGKLVAIFRDKDAHYEFGAIVLEFQRDPKRLTGHTTYVSRDDGLVTYPFMLRRAD